MAKKPAPPTAGAQPSERRRAVREQQQRQAAAAKRRRNLTQAGIIAGVAVLVVAIVASAVIIGHRSRSATTPTADTTVTVNGVSVPFVLDGSAVRLGPADAKARVDLWVDYSCPHCQEFEAANGTALNQLIAGGDVSVSYHNIQIVTDYGTAAGSAAACVATHDPSRWVGFNSALYANHSADTDGWTASQFRDLAQHQGTTGAALDCITASPYTGWIASNTADASQHQVTGTPTMFLNGHKSETLTGLALITKVNQLAGH